MRREVTFAAFLALSACSGGDSEAPARGPATPIDPATTGTIAGKVTFDGTPPAETELRVAGDATCASAHQGAVFAGDVKVRDGKVANAFVYVKKGLEKFVFDLPKTPVTIDQRGCIYHPRILGAQSGQEIQFLNSDPTLHNVHTTPKNSSPTNFGMSRQGTSRGIRIAKPEVMVAVKCDVHPWMRAYVGVLDHPHFALTGDDGSFELRNVPAGEYTLGVWHERFGEREAAVKVEAGKPSDSSFAFGG
jgi:plastocyanin